MVADEATARIAARCLTKTYGPVRAVDELTFTVEPGSVTGFLGPNGAGKTTRLRMLLGLVRPDSGSATIGGRAYRALPAPADQVGTVLEAFGFHPARTGRDHLRVYCAVNGYPTRRAADVLDLVGLTDAGGRKVGGYSLGMRQRLALAAALLGDPPVLVLDEPANGVDPEGIAWLRRLLRQFAAQGHTVLVSSHVLTEMQHLVDHVLIINQGRLVAQGTLADLAARHGAVVSVRTPQADRLLAALRRPASSAAAHAHGPRVQRTGPDSLRVTGMPAAQVGHLAFVEQVELHRLEDTRGDLEHVLHPHHPRPRRHSGTASAGHAGGGLRCAG
jgi:ABC-2 type transport system ATP-binding protein